LRIREVPMDKKIEQVTRRAKGYRYVDGTWELKLSLTLLILMAYLILPIGLPGWSYEGILLLVLSVLLIAGGGWVVDRIIQAIKEHITFRRSGFISDPKKKEPAVPAGTMVSFVVVGFLAWVMLIGFAEGYLTEKWMPLLPAVIFAVDIGIAAVRSAQRRYYFLAAASLLVGAAVALVNDGRWDSLTGMAIYMGMMSLILLCAGVFRLWNYLRLTPPVDDNPSSS